MIVKDLWLHKCPLLSLLSRIASSRTLRYELTTSATIAVITGLQGSARRLKISNTGIRQVLRYRRYDAFKNHSTQTRNYYYGSKSKKLDFLEQYITVNVKKVVVKILQGSAVTQTMLGGITIQYIFRLQISYGVYVPNIISKMLSVDNVFVCTMHCIAALYRL